MQEKLTLKQSLMIVREMLRSIGSVPIEYAEQIGVPVSRSINILGDCINAIRSETSVEEGQEEPVKSEPQEAENGAGE